jgi:hypothetical protein
MAKKKRRTTRGRPPAEQWTPEDVARMVGPLKTLAERLVKISAGMEMNNVRSLKVANKDSVDLAMRELRSVYENARDLLNDHAPAGKRPWDDLDENYPLVPETA